MTMVWHVDYLKVNHKSKNVFIRMKQMANKNIC